MNYPKEAIERLQRIGVTDSFHEDINDVLTWAEHFRPRTVLEERPDENSRVIYWDEKYWLGANGRQLMPHEFWFPAPPPPQEPTAVDRLWDSMKPALVSPDLREIMGHRLTKQELNIIIDQYEKVKGTK